MIAAQADLSKLIQLLLEAGVAVNSMTSKGYTALSLAALNRHEAAVRVLLAAGADPDHTTIV